VRAATTFLAEIKMGSEVRLKSPQALCGPARQNFHDFFSLRTRWVVNGACNRRALPAAQGVGFHNFLSLRTRCVVTFIGTGSIRKPHPAEISTTFFSLRTGWVVNGMRHRRDLPGLHRLGFHCFFHAENKMGGAALAVNRGASPCSGPGFHSFFRPENKIGGRLTCDNRGFSSLCAPDHRKRSEPSVEFCSPLTSESTVIEIAIANHVPQADFPGSNHCGFDPLRGRRHSAVLSKAPGVGLAKYFSSM
jgi:hypothetical protein